MRFPAITTRAVSLAAICIMATPPNADPKDPATIVLAGGCFWGTEAVFEHLRGVRSVTSGFARYWKSPSANQVPIEAVRVVYDPSQITYQQLLEVFFTVAHDPTSRDRQGPDAGPEYRAVVFYEASRERDIAAAYVAELARAQRFARPIVTEVRALTGFEIAPAFHQDYAARHPSDPYIVQNDAPKLVQLEKAFPGLYTNHRAP
jgi:peptide-methionine (S)-S-oxide reductase